MTRKVTLPTSIDEATAKLADLDALLTAKGWERAAIVYAFTYEGKGNRFGSKTPGGTADEKSSAMTITDFAALKIAGLGTRDTIRRYRELWAEHGDPDIGPGSRVELPEIDFPPTRTGTDGYESDEGLGKTLEKMVSKHGAEKVAEAIPAVAAPTVTRVLDTKDTEIVTADLKAKLGAEPTAGEVDSAKHMSRRRAESSGGTVAEESPGAAEWAGKHRRAAKRREDSRRAILSALALDIDDLLNKSRLNLTKALGEARGVTFEEIALELFGDRIKQIRAALDFFEVAIGGDVEFDWDEALASLIEDES